MRVFLTVDVESYSGHFDREVWGGGHGLGYLLKQCQTAGVRATFFVEALGAARWGVRSLRAIVQPILEAGQDAQLHIHPEVNTGRGPFWAFDRQEQTALLAQGLTLWRASGLPEAKAFRAGDLGADENTLEAMKMCGLFMGSNRDLDTKSSCQSRLNDAFPVRNDLSRLGEVVDLPVSAVRSPIPWLDGRYRHLQITAMGAGEMRWALERMEAAGYACAAILTHPAEYFFVDAVGRMRPQHKNRRRLESLLRWMAARAPAGRSTVGEIAAKRFDLPSESPPEICGHPLWALLRVLEQATARRRGVRT